jgi:hypothetical protein
MPPSAPARSTWTCLYVGTGEIVDRDAVVSAEGMEIDGLDIIHVHLDAGDVAGEQNMPVTRP